MALNSPKFNNLSTILSLGSGSNPSTPNETLFNNHGEAVNRGGQLGLNKSVTKLMRKTCLTAKRSARVQAYNVNATENVKGKESQSCHDTESILRVSQMVRTQLMRAASYPISNEVVPVPVPVPVPDTEEKKKDREMLQAQLLRASAFAHPMKNEVVVGSTSAGTNSKPTSFDIMTAHLKTHRFLNHFGALRPSPLTTYHPSQSNSNNNNNTNNANVSDTTYDGRTHSYPYKKNGPYSCPKCNHVSHTSQQFAAHVNSRHYKYESKSERKKRMMAKVRERTKNLRLQMLKEGLTIVPRDFVAAAADDARNNKSNVNVAPRPPVMVKIERVEVAEGVRVKYALAPPPGMELNPEAGVKIKLEPVDTI